MSALREVHAPITEVPGPRGESQHLLVGAAAGAGAMICVGGSVAVSGVLAGAPVFTAEALRYAMACLILVALARLTGRRLVLPRGTEWLWPAGVPRPAPCRSNFAR